jgi:hypothetical protein
MRTAISISISISIVLLLGVTARADDPKPTRGDVPATGPGVTPAEPAPVVKPADKPADVPATVSPFDSYTGANAQGRQFFDEGRQLLRDGNQDAACAKFAAAYKEEEATSTQLNVARCR